MMFFPSSQIIPGLKNLCNWDKIPLVCESAKTLKLKDFGPKWSRITPREALRGRVIEKAMSTS